MTVVVESSLLLQLKDQNITPVDNAFKSQGHLINEKKRDCSYSSPAGERKKSFTF